jgi:hypothetical protein
MVLLTQIYTGWEAVALAKMTRIGPALIAVGKGQWDEEENLE